eukprot:6480513-Amphidinium_carterae.1
MAFRRAAFATGPKGGAFGNTQVGTLCVHDETTSTSADCLREDLSSSGGDEIAWVSRDLLGGAQGFGNRGFASTQEEWNLYLDAAKHMREVDEDVARHTAEEAR